MSNNVNGFNGVGDLNRDYYAKKNEENKKESVTIEIIKEFFVCPEEQTVLLDNASQEYLPTREIDTGILKEHEELFNDLEEVGKESSHGTPIPVWVDTQEINGELCKIYHTTPLEHPVESVPYEVETYEKDGVTYDVTRVNYPDVKK